MNSDIQILREVDRKDREFDFRLDDRMHFSREKNSYNDKQLQSQLEIENHEKRIKASVKEYDPSGSNYVDGYVNIGGEELIRSRTSFTLDMATGQSSTVERGFNFDQADGVGERVVGARLRRLNSSLLSQYDHDEYFLNQVVVSIQLTILFQSIGISSPIEVRESNHMDQLFSRSNSEGADLNRVHEHLLKETSKQYNFANFSFASGERGSTHSLVPSKDHHKQLSSHEETSDHANRQETHDRSNQSSQHHLFREEYRIQTSHLTEARPTTDPRYRSIASEQAITESPQSYCDPWQQGKRRKAHEKKKKMD